jgi:hypothetical protein
MSVQNSLFLSLQPTPCRTPTVPEDTRGSIQLTLTYDPVAGILTVRLIEVRLLQTDTLAVTKTVQTALLVSSSGEGLKW